MAQIFLPGSGAFFLTYSGYWDRVEVEGWLSLGATKFPAPMLEVT